MTWWEENGYLRGELVEPASDTWLCLAPMLFTYRLMLCDPGSVFQFWCYPKELGLDHALHCFHEFAEACRALTPGEALGDPLPGWVKHHPSHRRVGAET